MMWRTIGVLLATVCGFAYAQSEDLVTAAKRGDVAAVVGLLRSGADANERGYTAGGTTTALIEASFAGHLNVVEALLAAKADVNATRSEKKGGETALTLAVQKGHLEVVRALLAAGADVNLANAVYEAAKGRNVALVKLLLTTKPDLNLRSKLGGTTALMWGIAQGPIEIARSLVEAGAKVNVSDDNGVTPLALAVEGRGAESLTLVQALLAAGARADSRECGKSALVPLLSMSYGRARGATALGLAYSNGNVEVVRALFAAKADVNLKQCDGSMPLTLALQNGHQEVADLLRSAGASQ